MSETEQLVKLIEDMSVPQLRRDATQLGNLMWLARNLGIRNAGHPNLDAAFAIIRSLMRQSGNDTSTFGWLKNKSP